jgi:predicted short-subunit dehydrogenase-like oxidoreductase (DUF2520 family)
MKPSPAAHAQRIAIFGPGRLGFTLARCYAKLGAEVHLVGRREGSWQDRGSEQGIATQVAASARKISCFADLDLLVFCVPDDALEDCARTWADACAPLAPPRLVVHTSGAAGLELLRPWRNSLQAVLHPMRVITGLARRSESALGTEVTPELDAAPVSVLTNQADAAALACAEVTAWGAEAIVFDSSADRRRYHLACCLAANHLTALLAWAEDLASPALGAAAARRGLVSLAASALAQVKSQGPAQALTGPVARGDAVTLQAHLDALSANEAERYRALLPELLGLALASGGISHARARELESQLGLAASPRGNAK